MGSGLVDSSPLEPKDEPVGKSTPIKYTDAFYRCFPYYLNLGMSYDLFWNEDCCLVKFYRQAYKIRQRERNYECWLQGAYFYSALADVAPALHPFAKKGTKIRPYLSEPLDLEQNAEQNVSKEKSKFDKQKAIFGAWVAETNLRFKKEGR